MADDSSPTRSLRGGDSAPKRTERQAGERVGQWLVGERLGGGGFGEVYDATHATTGERAALKILHAHFTASPEIVARFDREIRVLTCLKHPHVVQVIDAGLDTNGQPFLCMERLEGHDLDRVIAAKHHVDPITACKILEPLCDALAIAHESGIVHRDLKASNVFVCQPSGRVVLLDFGIAKISDALAPELTATHQSLGTPGSMAPEQIQGQTVDRRADIYALGGLLFHLLTGRRAFDDPSDTMTQYLHLHARRPRPSSLVPVSTAIDDVTVRAMAIDPDRRFADARAFIAALRNASRESLNTAGVLTIEHAAVFVAIEGASDADDLDEPMLADLEAVLPTAERALSEQGFTLVVDLGTSALFVAPIHQLTDPLAAAAAAWQRLETRPGRDVRVKVSLALHRGLATVAAGRVEPCALLRPETWGMPERIDGVWVSPAIQGHGRGNNNRE